VNGRADPVRRQLHHDFVRGSQSPFCGGPQADLSDTSGAAVPLQVAAVSKRFDRTVALDGVTFEVRAGEIFGLPGPNGAGKTTLIRTILDLIKPDSGRIELFGREFQREDRNRIGYLPEERGLHPRAPVGARLEYLGTLKGLTRADAAVPRAHVARTPRIDEAAARRVEQLSKGNQHGLSGAGLLQLVV
jgi:ABC-2 type transport system ATP-binding protein